MTILDAYTTITCISADKPDDEIAMTCSGREATRNGSLWNSLEIAKLAISTVTPFILAVLSYVVWDIQREVTERHNLHIKSAQAQEDLRELRTHFYSDTAPLLREILAYHFHVGSWKEESPAEVLKMKRKLDSVVYGHEAILSSTFNALYYDFMRQAFVSAGNGHDESRLRTSSKCRVIPPNEDETKWHSWFTEEDNRPALCLAYKNLSENWSSELLLPIAQANPNHECPPFYTFGNCS